MFSPDPQWFCVRSQPRRQNLAAAHLRSLGLEVFNPHLRLPRATRGGPQWRREALFPNYLFARFDAFTYRAARYACGVSDVVHFGDRWAVVPDGDIASLRADWGPVEFVEVPGTIRPGETVKLTGALFCGVEATVICLLPARQRVKVLLDLLGGLTETEVAASLVVPTWDHPLAA